LWEETETTKEKRRERYKWRKIERQKEASKGRNKKIKDSKKKREKKEIAYRNCRKKNREK
jgi:hypothetical protein